MQDQETGRLSALSHADLQRLLGVKNVPMRPPFLRKNLDKHLPIVQVGDVFAIRGCHFEVINMTEEGIFAKGISKKEFLDKKFKQ